jgi:hypothetical protein
MDGPRLSEGEAAARVLRRRVADRDVWLSVTGWSMWPTVRPPARVLVSSSTTPRRGEVWAFVAPSGAIVVHRCERRVGTMFLFRGDGFRHDDPLVSRGLLIGRVRRAEDADGTRAFGLADRARGAARSTLRRLSGRTVRMLAWAFRTIPATTTRWLASRPNGRQISKGG